MENIKEMDYIELFENTVFNNFNRIALKTYEEEITYGDLNILVSKIGEILRKKVKKDEIIGLGSDGKIFHFALMIASIKMGITFINLDLKSPKNYLNGIIEDLNIKKIITSENIYDYLEDSKEDNIKGISREKYENDTLFIVPTSGSTGRPKYVKKKMISLMKSYNQFKERVDFLFEKTMEQCAPLNFAFGLELSLIFLAGGNTICINEKKDYMDIKYLYENIEKNHGEIAFWPAPIIKLLSRQGKLINDIPKSLKYIIVGGEPIVVSAQLVFEFHRRNIKLLNNYGSTETGTVFFSPMDISLMEVEGFNQVSVGKPLEGFEILILNKNLDPCNRGNLYVVAKDFVNEYYQLPEEQKKKFFKDKRYEEGILCDMGDIGEYKNGKYYIVGRNNNCVNIRGYRVEIENIEFHITKILNGEECSIVSFENNFNETNIVCFYSSQLLDPMELRGRLEKEVPEYMIPKLFIQLKELYHLKNGKIDRVKMKELYEREYSNLSNGNIDLEENIWNLLEKVLGFKIIEENRGLSFKELGIDSLGFTDFISLLEEKEKINIEDGILLELFQGNIQDIMGYIKEKKKQ